MRRILLGLALVCTAAFGGWQFLEAQGAVAPQLPPSRAVQLPGDAPSPRFEITVAPATAVTVTVKHHIGSPEAYVPLVAVVGSPAALVLAAQTPIVPIGKPE